MKRERTKLTELGELFSRVYKLALKKDIQNEDNFYNFDSMRYAGILTEINKILRLKRDMGYCFGLHETDRSICSNTDEQLVSAAACLAEAGRHPAIIAEDIDIQRLAKYGLGILYAPEFSPRNNRAAEYLAESRVRVYLPEDNKDYNSADNGSYGQVYISPLTFGWSVEKIIEELWRGDKARKKFEKPSIEKIEQISEKVHDFWKNL